MRMLSLLSLLAFSTQTGTKIDIDRDSDGYTLVDGDCDDGDPAIHPGAPERCNGLDDDCSGAPGADEDDLDGDGYRICEGDCDDGNAAVSPGAVELECNGLDDDCEDDTLDDPDGDADGYGLCEGDCDDGDATVHPDAIEVADDDVDQDCDGTDATSCYLDTDGDGYGGVTQVVAPDGSCDSVEQETTLSGDCDDNDASVFPGAEEIVGDGLDQNCDGTDQAVCYLDLDSDGHGDPYGLFVSDDGDCDDVGEALVGSDCDDGDATVHPGAFEAPADGIDSDCDGSELCYLDSDEDGHGTDELVPSGLDCGSAGVAPIPGEACPGFDDDDDPDGDGVPTGCDDCPDDAGDDSDGDGVCDSDDACPGGDDSVDLDGDGIPDECDASLPGSEDSDGDGIPDSQDPAPTSAGDDGMAEESAPRFGFGCASAPAGLGWVGLLALALVRRPTRRRRR